MEDIGVTVLGPGGSGFGTLLFCCCCFSVGSLFHSVIFFALTFFYFLHHQFLSVCLSLSFDSLLIKSRTYCTQLSALAGWLFYNGFCMECLLINPKLVFTFFFAFRAKLIHAFFVFTSSTFFFVVSCCFSLFLSLLLSRTFLFPPLFLSFPFFLLLLLLLDHCVARARICVAGDRWPFVPTSKKGEKCTHSNAHTRNHRTQCNIGNIAEGDHSSG